MSLDVEEKNKAEWSCDNQQKPQQGDDEDDETIIFLFIK
jgi:hypothetical protein